MYSIDVLDTCGAMSCSYFGITFLLFFIRINNTVYTSFQNRALLFINGLIFDIMNIQNSQSFEFEWIPMIAPLRSVSDRTFSWLHNVSVSLSKIGWILFSNSKEIFKKILDGQKMFISEQTYEGLKISVN